jgi:hypothetical protein
VRSKELEADIDKLGEMLQPTNSDDSFAVVAFAVDYIADREPELIKRMITETSRNRDWEYWYLKMVKLVITHNDGTHSPYGDLVLGVKRALALRSLVIRINVNGGDISNIPDNDTLLIERSVETLISDSKIDDPSEELYMALGMISYIRGEHATGSWADQETDYTSFALVSKDAVYIADHLEEVELMIPELRARKTFDREAIEQLRNSPARVLRGGEL